MGVLGTSLPVREGLGMLGTPKRSARDAGDSLPLREQLRVLGTPKEGAGGVGDPQRCSCGCWGPPAHPPLM